MGTDKIKDRNLDPKLKETIATKQELEQLQTTINTELENVKKSASDGKSAIATAITNKGVSTSSDATYATMATNIGSIVTINDVPNQGAQTITPGTSNKTIPAGTYLTGVQTIAGDADLISSNIKSGANIFGVAGNANVVDTSAGDATAAQILSGKKAYVDGSLITGSMTDRGAVSQTLAANGTYTIPAGYHNGSGKVTQSLTTKAATTWTPKTSN